MSRLLWVVIFLLAAFLVLREVAIAAEPVIVEQTLEVPERLTVGDHFRYVIKVESDVGTTVFLAPGGLPNVLELTKTPVSASRAKGNGRIETTLTLEVAAFLPGEVALQPLQLRYRDQSGATGDLRTEPARINVASVLPSDGTAQIRDLKPQAEINTPPATWVFVAIGAAFVALIVVVGLLLWRRRVLSRRAGAEEAVAEPEPESPEDRARRVLDEAGRRFATASDYMTYYGTIGGTVRDYLTQRYGFGAFALTTVELQNEMQRRGVDRWQARLVGGLLTQCDSAVYAGYRPAHERADADLTAAYEIVEMSRPQEPLVEVSAT